MAPSAFTIAVACNNDRVLEQNLLRSPDLAAGKHQVLLKRGFASASLAYNSALNEATHDIVVFVHQDLYLPEGWFDEVERAIAQLEAASHPWGVLGSFGSRRNAPGGLGTVYTVGLGRHGKFLDHPEPVESLDEIVLVVRRSSGLRFDDAMPHYHLHGTDICMTALNSGLGAFAVQAYCVHNCRYPNPLPPEFFSCYRYIRQKWKRALPIHTACITVSRFNLDLLRKRAGQLLQRLRRHQPSASGRVNDPTQLDVFQR